jgi:hypothetical protein
MPCVGAFQAPPGAFQLPSWPEDAPAFAPATPPRQALRKRLRLGSSSVDEEPEQATAAAQASSTGAGRASRNWRLHVRELQSLVDGRLKDALAGALLMLKDPVRRLTSLHLFLSYLLLPEEADAGLC